MVSGMGRVRVVNVNNDKVYPLTRVLRDGNCILANSSGGRDSPLGHMGTLNVGIFVKRDTSGMGSTRLIICSTTVSARGPRVIRTRHLNVPAVRHDRLLNTLAHGFSGIVNMYNARNGASIASVVARVLVLGGVRPATIVNNGLPLVGSGNVTNGDRVVIYRDYRFISAFLRLSPSVAILLGVSGSRLSCFGAVRGVIHSFGGFITVNGIYCMGNSSRLTLSTARNLSVGAIAFNFDSGGRCITGGRGANGFNFSFSMCGDNRGLVGLRLGVPNRRGVLGTLSTFTITCSLNMSTRNVGSTLRDFANTNEHFRFLNRFSNFILTSSCTRRPARVGTALATTGGLSCGHMVTIFRPFAFSHATLLGSSFVGTLSVTSGIVLAPVVNSHRIGAFGVCSRSLRGRLGSYMVISNFRGVTSGVVRATRSNSVMVAVNNNSVCGTTCVIESELG